MLLQAIDYATTVYLVTNYGLKIEANPLVKYILSTNNGYITFALIKFLLCLLSWQCFNKNVNNKNIRKIFLIMNLIYFVVCLNNLAGVLFHLLF